MVSLACRRAQKWRGGDAFNQKTKVCRPSGADVMASTRSATPSRNQPVSAEGGGHPVGLVRVAELTPLSGDDIGGPAVNLALMSDEFTERPPGAAGNGGAVIGAFGEPREQLTLAGDGCQVVMDGESGGHGNHSAVAGFELVIVKPVAAQMRCIYLNRPQIH